MQLVKVGIMVGICAWNFCDNPVQCVGKSSDSESRLCGFEHESQVSFKLQLKSITWSKNNNDI